jgi:hypothetical protein
MNMRRRPLHFITSLALIFSIITIGGTAAVNFGFQTYRMRMADGGWRIGGGLALLQSAIRNPPSAIRNQKVRNPQSGAPWINLKDGQELPTAYAGAAGLEAVMNQGLALPTALASDDFDEDGMPDLIARYAGPGGGLITLHRGNEGRKRMGEWANGGMGENPISHSPTLPLSHSPFLLEARVFELPGAPDFLGAGDFDGDGHRDVAAAARGGQAVWLLPGDGRGGFGEAKQIPLTGQVTAMTVGEINRADGLADVIVGIDGSNGPQVLVFESPEGAFGNDERGAMNDEWKTSSSSVQHSAFSIQHSPEAFALPAPVTALALGQLDESEEMDLAVAAGTDLLIIHGRDRRLSLDEIRQAETAEAVIEEYRFEFNIAALAIGDFVWDREHRSEAALLGDDGQVHLLVQEVVSAVRGGRRAAPDQPDEPAVENEGGDALAPTQADSSGWPQRATRTDRHSPSFRWTKPWSSQRLGLPPLSPTAGLLTARVSSRPTEDLVIMDRSHQQVHILTTDDEPMTSDGPMTLATLAVAGAPVAVLPLRLNVDALSDLVILREGSTTPAVVLTAPLATFEVNSTGDGATYTGPVVVTLTETTVTFRSGPGDPNFLTGGMDIFRHEGHARLQAPRSTGPVFIIGDSDTCDSGPCP